MRKSEQKIIAENFLKKFFGRKIERKNLPKIFLSKKLKNIPKWSK